MNTSLVNSSSAPPTETPEEISRRRFFEKLSIALVGLCTAIVGLPLVGFIVAPFFRKVPEKWVTIGKPDDFQIGKTVAITVTDPSPLPWAGVTAKSAVWLRRVAEDSFIAFSANCMHLGCPVRWLPDADLFMCPCHGGVYYSDGKVAAGPPPRPLFRYEVRIANGELQMKQAIVPISTTL
jgi:quinol---cytochrome c reductase iron-sulfur subunit, bacillus type